MNTLKVVKIGGNIINNKKVLAAFLADFSKLPSPKVLVHGGGKSATELAKKMNIPVKMIDGRRITDTNTLNIITMVYAGKINKNIVAQLQANNANSVGFSGADGNTIVSIKRPVDTIDYGFVGDVKKVDTSVIETLLDANIVPVFCAITHDKKGQLLNTNADTIASELAIGLSVNFKTELYYCFEKNGVLLDIEDANSVIENIDTKTYQKLKDQKLIFDGMLPKLNNCFYALNKGVNKVHIGATNMLFNTNTKRTIIQL